MSRYNYLSGQQHEQCLWCPNDEKCGAIIKNQPVCVLVTTHTMSIQYHQQKMCESKIEVTKTFYETNKIILMYIIIPIKI